MKIRTHKTDKIIFKSFWICTFFFSINELLYKMNVRIICWEQVTCNYKDNCMDFVCCRFFSVCWCVLMLFQCRYPHPITIFRLWNSVCANVFISMEFHAVNDVFNVSIPHLLNWEVIFLLLLFRIHILLDRLNQFDVYEKKGKNYD